MCIFIIIIMVEQYFYYRIDDRKLAQLLLLIKILTIVNSYTYNKTIVHPHIDIMANVFKPYQPASPASLQNKMKLKSRRVRAFNFFQSFKVV